MQSLVNQEAGFLENDLVKNEQGDLQHFQNQNVVFAGVNQFFYYVVNANGQVLTDNKSNPRLRPDLLRQVNGRFENYNGIRQETLNLGHNHRGRGDQDSTMKPHDFKFLFWLIKKGNLSILE